MKTNLLKGALITILLALPASPFDTCFGQGSLTPPGAPAPTMKTLSQIEPRIIINAAGTPGDSSNLFNITQPGSYYLTTNIYVTSSQNGITIKTNNVTLDLGGFMLQGVPAEASYGIFVPGTVTNLTVRNGTISGWGAVGLSTDSSYNSENVLVEHLNVSGCGYGMTFGNAAQVRDCNVDHCSVDGIDCEFGGIVADCSANNNGEGGIAMENGNVTDCHADGNYFGVSVYDGNASSCSASDNTTYGLQVVFGAASVCDAQQNFGSGITTYSSTISGCAASYNNNSGIQGDQSRVSGCTANFNSNNGIECDNQGASAVAGTVSDCVAQDNHQNGIFVNGTGGLITGNDCEGNNTTTNSGCAGINIYGSSAGNRVENNHVAGTGYAGISVSGTGNLIIKNSVFGDGANDFIISGTQITGPIISATGTISSTSPWANFSF